jgi:hypothetical protein
MSHKQAHNSYEKAFMCVCARVGCVKMALMLRSTVGILKCPIPVLAMKQKIFMLHQLYPHKYHSVHHIRYPS